MCFLDVIEFLYQRDKYMCFCLFELMLYVPVNTVTYWDTGSPYFTLLSPTGIHTKDPTSIETYIFTFSLHGTWNSNRPSFIPATDTFLLYTKILRAENLCSFQEKLCINPPTEWMVLECDCFFFFFFFFFFSLFVYPVSPSRNFKLNE